MAPESGLEVTLNGARRLVDPAHGNLSLLEWMRTHAHVKVRTRKATQGTRSGPVWPWGKSANPQRVRGAERQAGLRRGRLRRLRCGGALRGPTDG